MLPYNALMKHFHLVQVKKTTKGKQCKI